MTKYELVQNVQKLIEAYNQTHDDLLYVDWSNGFYYIGHPDIPEFKYNIDYFNRDGNPYIQVVFKTMTQLIAIYKTLANDFHSNDIQFYDDHIELFDDKHQTILKPLSDQMVTIEQTYRPSLTELSFQKDGVDIFLVSDSPYHSIDAFYTANALVSFDKINNTIKALKEKTQDVL